MRPVVFSSEIGANFIVNSALVTPTFLEFVSSEILSSGITAARNAENLVLPSTTGVDAESHSVKCVTVTSEILLSE